MKRLLYLVVFLLIALCGQSQTINQKGVTYRDKVTRNAAPSGGGILKPVRAITGGVGDRATAHLPWC